MTRQMFALYFVTGATLSTLMALLAVAFQR